MLSPFCASQSAPSPSMRTVMPSASSATTSLWSDSARPSVSKPGPRFAEVAGTRTWTRTRLQPLQEPVGGERDRPGVQDDVVVREDEDPDDDEDHTGGALDDRDERPIAVEEAEERAERRRRDQERQPEPGGVGYEQADAALDRLRRAGEREDRAPNGTDAGRPTRREGDADRERAQVACGLLADLPLL